MPELGTRDLSHGDHKALHVFTLVVHVPLHALQAHPVSQKRLKDLEFHEQG